MTTVNITFIVRNPLTQQIGGGGGPKIDLPKSGDGFGPIDFFHQNTTLSQGIESRESLGQGLVSPCCPF